MTTRRVSRRVLGATALSTAAGGALFLLPQEPALGESVNAPVAQATAVSPQPTAVSPQPLPPGRPLQFFDVDARFRAYYASVDGPRTMGRAISPLLTVGGLQAQYFEKARLEDHRATNRTGNAAYDFEYGLLVDEMKDHRSLRAVGGDESDVTYDTIHLRSDPSLRGAPPAGFRGGDAQPMDNGTVFIPFTADLSSAPGHLVPAFFWEFMNRTDLFPGGWLHDIGLPITPAIPARVNKGRIIGDQIIRVNDVAITVQAFQRTILTHDPANPAGFLTERANTGTDYFFVFPNRFP